MALLERHLEFIDALRRAGLPVSMTEDLDAIAALSLVPLDDRDTVREAYAATLVKRHLQRPAFDALFEAYFPRRVGDGARGLPTPGGELDKPVGDNLDVLETVRRRIERALRDSDLDDQLLRQLAAEAVGRFGQDPSRTDGPPSWSMYETLQRLDVQGLVNGLIDRLLSDGTDPDAADALAQRRMSRFIEAVSDDIDRRKTERQTPERRATETVRPVLDKLAFSAARHADIVAMRREIFPLARRLATRLARERRALGGGPLHFRRTIRAAMGTGGVPLTTHHRPKRPHRPELVVLCDISGSVADFAQFTLMFVFALREVFHGLRAFTFVDSITEVTDRFLPGADAAGVMAELAGSTREALLAGRSDYGRVFERFAAEHPGALGPKTTLLVLGDARSNYSALGEATLANMVGKVKHAFWLNPEPRQDWGIGDSAAHQYAQLIEMVECRNLEQLSAFVHDLL